MSARHPVSLLARLVAQWEIRPVKTTSKSQVSFIFQYSNRKTENVFSVVSQVRLFGIFRTVLS